MNHNGIRTTDLKLQKARVGLRGSMQDPAHVSAKDISEHYRGLHQKSCACQDLCAKISDNTRGPLSTLFRTYLGNALIARSELRLD